MTRRPALWRYLWRWTLGALALAWLTLMAASYYAGLHEADEITDAHLASAVNVLLQVSAFGTPAGDPSAMQIPAEREFQSFIPLGRHLNLARSLAVVVWDNGSIVADSRPLDQRWTVNTNDGYSTFEAPVAGGGARHQWRMFAAQRLDNGRRAAAMIDVDQRARIGRHVALTIARPALIVLPLVAWLLWWAMRRGLRPLNTLSSRVGALQLHRGERLQESHGFAEFASMVAAINGLIDRLQSQAARERAFASDVAHEMRTPLAAITLQASTASTDADPHTRSAALQQVQREVAHAGRILTELLDLARAERCGDDAMHDVDLGELAARVMGNFAQASHESGHVLELRTPTDPVEVHGNPLLLELALRNLIANALDHTGPGTLVQVEVARDGGGCRLAVSDSGVPRAQGQDAPEGGHLGIGLTLVRRIAGLHHAQFIRQAGAPPLATRYALVWTPHGPPR